MLGFLFKDDNKPWNKATLIQTDRKNWSIQ